MNTNANMPKLTSLCLSIALAGALALMPLSALSPASKANAVEAAASTSVDSLLTGEVGKPLVNGLTAENVGIGGGGALFDPAISPHNPNEMVIRPDMGGLYVTHDRGKHWERPNLHGTVRCVHYDPNLPGVMYAGGTGLWKSTDYGHTFKLMFPNPSDVVARRTQVENNLQYFVTKTTVKEGAETVKLYDSGKSIKDVLVDPTDSNHIFALGYYNKNGLVYESTDGGESFVRLFKYTKPNSKSMDFEPNKLIYKRETKEIFVATNERLVLFNRATGAVTYNDSLQLADVATVYDNAQGTTFIGIKEVSGQTDRETDVFLTKDFTNLTIITDKLIGVARATFDYQQYNGPTWTNVTYKHRFRYIAATSLDNIYVAGFTNQNVKGTVNGASKDFPYAVGGLFRLRTPAGMASSPSNLQAEYLYGLPYRDQNNITTKSWTDGNTYAYGMCEDPTDPDSCLFTTIVGVYLCQDDDSGTDDAKIHALHSTKAGNAWSTNGIDEQTTYGVRIDPFHPNVMLLLDTDLGMLRSEDHGKSWVQVTKDAGMKGWHNTSYDAIFDARRENVVYSLWSSRANLPYSPVDESLKVGGFARSTNGGQSWDCDYSSGLPANAEPVEMVVSYPEGTDECTIYVATFNHGFFVSHNSGKTFTELNNGIEPVTYRYFDSINPANNFTRDFILGTELELSEGRLFAMTGKSTYKNAAGGNDVQPGRIYEMVGGKWVELPLPEGVTTPREMVFHNGALYVCCVAQPKWSGGAFTNHQGGVYAYRNGEFEQVFDESVSTNGIAFDAKGTMFVADIEGNIFRKEASESEFTKIYADYHCLSKYLQLEDGGNTLYLSTLGGGVLKLSGLNSLYDKGSDGNPDSSASQPSSSPQSSDKQPNTVKKAVLSKSFKTTKLKSKGLTFSIAAKTNDGAKITYKASTYLKSGKITKAKAKKYIKVASNGKVTIKKGAPKGTYKVKVMLTIAETGSHQKTTVIKTIQIKLK